MKVIKAIDKGLYQGERIFTIATFVAMMFIMFLQVFFRYIIKANLAWSEESMRYLFVVTSFFGAACATYERKHVVIDFLGVVVEKFFKNENHREAIYSGTGCLVNVVSTVFFIYIGTVMFRYAAELQSKNHTSSVMMMPLWWVGYAVSLALFLCAFHNLLGLFESAEVFVKDMKVMKGGGK
ncbi:MAG: TRAP transporter small permease [Lawsonibacter sp.]|nr:TRAP transporter small permease [Lawsonibacter sp.]